MTLTAAAVEAEALSMGFVAAGVATLEPSSRGDALDRWLAAGYAGHMRYLHRQARRRKAPATIVDGARCAVVVLENYTAAPDERPAPGDAFRVAAYARGTDYHLVTQQRLETLAAWMRERGAAIASAWVDAGPVPERELAERAGLGWIGKNTMLIHPRLGSYTFIGAVFTDLDLEPSTPLAADLCGTCTRCLQACPTGAIAAERLLDATLCLSYQTIENRFDPPEGLEPAWSGWAFGCDICNDACPWNIKFAEPTTIDAFRARPHPDRRDPAAFERVDDDTYARRYADTPLARPGAARMRRNARLATRTMPRDDTP